MITINPSINNHRIQIDISTGSPEYMVGVYPCMTEYNAYTMVSNDHDNGLLRNKDQMLEEIYKAIYSFSEDIIDAWCTKETIETYSPKEIMLAAALEGADLQKVKTKVGTFDKKEALEYAVGIIKTTLCSTDKIKIIKKISEALDDDLELNLNIDIERLEKELKKLKKTRKQMRTNKVKN